MEHSKVCITHYELGRTSWFTVSSNRFDIRDIILKKCSKKEKTNNEVYDND